MRILITGAHGLLGQKLALVLGRETDHDLLLTDIAPRTFFIHDRYDYQQLDITRLGDVKSQVAYFRPDVIINTAAQTDVDACEEDRLGAWRLNVDGLKNLIIPARRIEGCRIVQISSDYVFDGTQPPYSEESRPRPVSYYGKSKLAAENALRASAVDGIIVRTQVLYGTGYQVRSNFVAWVLTMLEKGNAFRVVTDQRGNPTMADDLAYGIFKLIDKKCMGVYHVSGPESIDRFSFSRRIAEVFGFDPSLIAPATSREIGQSAHRPPDSTFITLRFESQCDFRLSDTATGLSRLRQQYREGAAHTDLLDDSRFPSSSSG
ncbi:MAG: SDR family oxidoreductase [Bacteroidetes bacterium]|nr:SDR family oxidoreductase [Bacteroidota bacterium]